MNDEQDEIAQESESGVISFRPIDSIWSEIAVRRYHRPARTQVHRRRLAGLRFEQPAHHIVLEDHIATIEAATARRDRLTEQIEGMLADWSLAPLVEALQALRFVALVDGGDGGRRTR